MIKVGAKLDNGSPGAGLSTPDLGHDITGKYGFLMFVNARSIQVNLTGYKIMYGGKSISLSCRNVIYISSGLNFESGLAFRMYHRVDSLK